MNWRDRLGLITVTVGGKQAVGTGFWITRNRVVTARHVFDGAVDWSIQPVNRHAAIPLNASMIRWRGEDLQDVVILEVEHPDSRLSESVRFSGRIVDAQACEAAGFASASARSPAEPSLDGSICPLSGKLHPSTTSSTILNFSVEQGWEKVEQLGGISGAPLMVRGQLYGIVRGGPDELNGRSLYIVDLHQIVSPQFFEALGLPRVQDRCETLLEKAKALLVEQQSLVRELTLETQRLLSLPFAEWDEARLITELHQSVPVRNLLGMLGKMQRQAVNAGNASQREKIRDLGQLLVPVAFWRDLDFGRTRISTGFMSLPFFNKVSAEIVQAAFDGRRLELIPLLSGALLPQKAIDAPTPPEDGASAKQAEEDFIRVLFEILFEDPQIEPYLRLFRESSTSVSNPKRIDELLKLLNYSLGKVFEHSAAIYYLVIDRETRNLYGRHGEAVLKRLKDLVPNLRLVVLDGEDDEFAEEGYTLIELQDFYQLSHQAT